MICLDTNAVIAALNPNGMEMRRRLSRTYLERAQVGIPTIVLFELWWGIRNSARPVVNEEALETFLKGGVAPWPFEPDDAKDAGDIRASLRRAGTPIGPYDILIAAQARRRGAVLITANKREFLRVPGLKVEDWTLAD